MEGSIDPLRKSNLYLVKKVHSFFMNGLSLHYGAKKTSLKMLDKKIHFLSLFHILSFINFYYENKL